MSELPFCPNCGATMILKEKNGQKFWGCPAWKEKGCKTLPYEPPKPKERFQEISKPIGEDKSDIILAEIKKLNERFDKLGEYLKKEMGD